MAPPAHPACPHYRQSYAGKLLPCATPGCQEGVPRDVLLIPDPRREALSAQWRDAFELMPRLSSMRTVRLDRAQVRLGRAPAWAWDEHATTTRERSERTHDELEEWALREARIEKQAGELVRYADALGEARRESEALRAELAELHREERVRVRLSRAARMYRREVYRLRRWLGYAGLRGAYGKRRSD